MVLTEQLTIDREGPLDPPGGGRSEIGRDRR